MTKNYKAYQHGVIFSGAPHDERQLTESQCKELLNAYKGLFVRNVYDFDCKEQTSFWYVIQDKPITIEELHTKCRNQVRRSYKELEFRKVEIEGGGNLEPFYNVYVAAFSRYKIHTSNPMPKEQWIGHIVNSKNNLDLWGAYERSTGELVAFAEVLIQSNAAKYTALKAIPEKMNKTYPFYGLLFEMNKYYIEEKKLFYVTDGARSVTEHSNIQPFLEKFNFRRAYCKIKITYIWWLQLIVNILYPFKRVFGSTKIGYLLRLEAINRNEY